VGSKVKERTGPSWPLSTPASLPAEASHSLTDLSASDDEAQGIEEAEAMR
jgi:hypothetical protein